LAFKVAARTVLELGAELISSDAVAIYELVKNAIDARSPDGVTIEFCITMRHSDYVDALSRVQEILAARAKSDHPPTREDQELADLKASTLARVLPNSPITQRQAITRKLQKASTLADFINSLKEAYTANNWIEFRDSGRGMSRDDLLHAYLVIGTPSRRRALDATVAAGRGEAPYLGEKGVGRLSAMRLGAGLQVKTATADDTYINVLDVDWSEFEDLNKMVEDIVLKPRIDGEKPTPSYSGTVIRISGLNASWSPRRIRDIASYELSRLSDPFSKSKRRFRVEIIFNGDRIDIPRLDRAILELAHARVRGNYIIENGQPKLEVDLWCGDLGRGNPPDQRRIYLEQVDLRSLTRDSESEIPASALRTVGPFSFELYWYNRRLLRGIDTIGERKRVLALQAQWSGIMLFRNGYRVFPYGDDKDDWLGLDRRALASPGYKLNKAQFIGRVSISRTANPRLIDQTNREGLKDCDEKEVLIEVLRFVIQDRLRSFLDEVERRYQQVELDFGQTERRVQNLETRAAISIRELEKRHREEKPQLRELLSLFEEMRAYFSAAKQRAEQIEDERDRMIQLAGVGLMLEIVAHELARSTETTLGLLNEADADELPEEVASLFSTMRDEMKSMNRRLRVLDPLSVSSRQRKETFDFVSLVREIFAGHASQFRRHRIEAMVHVANGRKQVMVHGVRGMFVQILENLVQNSVYWIDLRRLDEEDYHPRIEVRIGDPPNLMEYTDNGPGIQPSLRDEVFKPFFSTKGKSRRQGLGLYIARDCAAHHEGQLYLSDERRIHSERLNTFVLELPSLSQ
jgi:signal transduction histidine kinase